MSRSGSKPTAKKIFGVLHLWLGLLSGLVIFIVGLTGAIYAFQPELSKLTQPYLSVKEENKPFFSPDKLRSIAASQLPGIHPNRLIFRGKDQSAVVHFFGKKPKPYYHAVFLNPYSGEVLKVTDMNTDFFRFILNGHMYLWLPQPVGHAVVAWATVIFLAMIISGIVLWWPRNKAARKNSFKVKWDASPKRLNYDLHNVFGFYASWILLFIVLTGLVWSFEWVANAEYWVFSGGNKKPAIPQPLSAKITEQDIDSPLDKIFSSVTTAYPATNRYQIAFPATDSAAVIVRVYPDKNTFYRMDNLYFDQYTAKPVQPGNYLGKYADADGGEKAGRMNFDIHTGAIAGLPGRILVCFAGLMAASLPVTGFYIWWGKKKKSPAKKQTRKTSLIANA